MAIEKHALIAALDEKLRIADFDDFSNNGLQVDSSRNAFAKVCSGVDASLEFFEEAARRGADLVICHHGLSWGDSLKYVTGANFKLVSFLVEHKMALWACHLPLDAHPELGNNAQLCAALGLVNRVPFGHYHGKAIGFAGELPSPLPRTVFEEQVKSVVSPAARTQLFGAETIRTVGVVSGRAPDLVAEAVRDKLDAFLTGEADLISYNACKLERMNVFAPGHYATERFGIRAVGNWIADEFGLAHEFVDFGIPY